MLLVIDIGNTNIKIGVFDGDDNLMDSIRLATSTNKTSDEYGLSIVDMLKVRGIERTSITAVIISSVNPNLNYTFEHLCTYYFSTTPLFVGVGIKTGINVKYDNPRELGADRIVNSVAGYYTYGAPLIIIDCGTATTFNVINEKGEFLGGAITTGLKTSADSLSRSAAKLPKVELSRPLKVVGKSTTANMQAGLIYGFVGSIEYLVAKIKEETGFVNAKVVATGGLSEMVASISKSIDIVDRTLTLRGLNLIYKNHVGDCAKVR